MKAKIIAGLVILSLVSLGITYGVLKYSYSTGVRSGKLVKISKKGVVLPTYEGTLDLGSGDKLTWDFSVHKDEIGEELAKQSGKFVTLEYSEHLFKLFYATKYNVIGWSRSKNANEDQEYFCRLVNILRKKRSIVDTVRPLIEQFDSELLTEVRNCQK